MIELAIKRALGEDTRVQSVWMRFGGKIEVFSLHMTDREAIITDHSDYSKIYAIYSLDFYNRADMD